jgi:hypothetical protein
VDADERSDDRLLLELSAPDVLVAGVVVLLRRKRTTRHPATRTDSRPV